MKKIQKWAELKTEINKYLPEYEYDKESSWDWYYNVGKKLKIYT